LDGNRLTVPPATDEVEISVFGPGYGESILLHIGKNVWFVVDSCIDPLSKKPAPLAYFQQIGIDPAHCVRQVIASHWHDDHIRGLGKLFRACSNAEFVCSSAIQSKEFLEIVRAYGTRAMMESTGTDEFNIVLDALRERAAVSGLRYMPPRFARANLLLWQNTDCTIHALSPSDASILAAQLDLARLFPAEKEAKRRLLATDPNKTAVVLWIRIGDFVILLGSDLDETTDDQRGWSVIINSSLRPSGKASLFKIPHHGSDNAHTSGVWSELLLENPFAALTPYEKGDMKLPTRKDVERICSHTTNAYSTAVVGRKRIVKRDRTVEKTIRETVLDIKQLHTSIGHVRFRANVPNDWSVELFGDALPLKGLYSPSL